MAVQKIYIGSLGPFLYDDADLIGDVDGDFSGETFKGLAITGDGVVGGSLDVGTLVAGELRLTPKASSTGPEGTMYYDSDDDHVYVATE